MFLRGFSYHKTLAPRVWTARRTVDALVAQSLQLIAWECVRYFQMVGIPLAESDVRDIIIHGSITNYYWDKHSDIDLCIMADLSRVYSALPPETNWYMLYKSLIHSWKRTFDISIMGRGVDISIVDVMSANDMLNDKVGSKYSLLKDMWIYTPVRLPDDKVRELRRDAYKKYRVIMRQCKYMLKHNMSDTFIDAYLVNLQEMRKRSMFVHPDQPITSMTMAFKMVRNSGTLRRLRARAKKLRSKTYRLD